MSLTQLLVSNVSKNGLIASKGMFSYQYSTIMNANSSVNIGMNGGTFPGYAADQCTLYFLQIQMYNSHQNALYYFMENGSFLRGITTDSDISLSYSGESYTGGTLTLTNHSGNNHTFIVVLTQIGLSNF